MKVGLTGGIGCGKSTVVGIFETAGWSTVKTDGLVRELLDRDRAVQSALKSRWGNRVVTEGAIDRKAVAAIVFADEAELDWRETRLHPLVRREWKRRLAAAPEADWVVELPLLFEKRLETEFDFTVCLSSPLDVVESRMVERGLSKDEFTRRRLRQMPLSEKVERAHYVISNAGTLEFLEAQTRGLIGSLQRLPQANG